MSIVNALNPIVAIRAQVGWCLYQKRFLFPVVVSGMATQAGSPVAVCRARVVLMAGAAPPAYLNWRGSLEAEQQASVSAAVYMIAAWTVAGLASATRRRALLPQLAVRRIGDLAGRLLVAGQAGVAAHILRSLRLCRGPWV